MSVLVGAPATHRPRRLGTTLWYVTAVVIAAISLFPIYWSVTTSLKKPAEAVSGDVTYWPRTWSLDSYREIAERDTGGLVSSLLNSLTVTGLTIVMVAVLSSLAGYGLSRFRFRGQTVAFALILVVLMVPFQSILIPLYVQLTSMGLSNSLLGLALIYTTFQLPFSTFVMRNSFDQIPRELDESAMVDGAGSLRTLVHVLLPSTWPGLATVVLFAFLFAWNEFLAALVMLGDPAQFTVPVMLNLIVANQYGTVVWGPLQAGVVVAMLPCMVVFLLLQRHYVAGAMAGAVKG